MRLLLAVLLGVIGVPLATWCETPILRAQVVVTPPDKTSDAILRRVDEHYNHLASLRTQYTERYAGMGMDRSETGTLLLKKPGRMKWIYDKPAGKLFILDGKYGWSYTPGDTQATRIAAKKLDDLRSPLRFLLGHTELKKELENVSVSPDGTEYTITGVPKGMAQRVKSLSLKVNATGAIETMRLEELDGSLTEFGFSGMQENVAVRDADFVFTPPPGVAVVDGLPSI
jgi:outer membrane lipoprotein carrier protein